MLVRVALVSLFSFSMACGDSGSTEDAGAGNPSGGNGSGAQASGAEGSGAGNGEGGGIAGGAGSGGAPALLPTCFHTCGSPADCASASPAVDADNWTCSLGLCEYLGCLSDSECQQTYANPAYVCDDGLAFPTCVLSCDAPADCATASTLTDADNWACTASVCEYLGCNSDAECQETYVNPSYVCDDTGVIPGCYLGCDTPADCATASLLTDADNWACNEHCEFLGCNSDRECQSGFSNPDYVCH